MQNAIEMVNITKTFGDKVVANSNVTMNIRHKEILSLLGENGSGKTTLMNMLAGIYYPDSGQIFFDGKEVSITSPSDAYHLGIGMVHQHFKLIDVFSALENILLGLPSSLDPKEVRSKVEEICNKYGFELNLDAKVYDMSVSEKQTLEIVKTLYRGAEVLILDEPTAVLTPQETRKLFNVIKNMRDDGKAIVIITHKLNEVLEVSDRVTILRKGEYVGTVDTKDATEQLLTEMMVGQKVELNINRDLIEHKEKRLEVAHLSVTNNDGKKVVNDATFDLYSGEIMGIAGISGCGQKELLEAIMGLTKADDDSSVIYHSTAHGDHQLVGLSTEMAQKIMNDLDVKTPSLEYPLRRLSGGNIQKVLVGREVAAKPTVLMTAYAVRGLDINTSYTIYNLLNEEKKKGVAVIYVGEDLDVLLALCDRILVMCDGHVNGILDGRKCSKEELGYLMTNLKEA